MERDGSPTHGNGAEVAADNGGPAPNEKDRTRDVDDATVNQTDAQELQKESIHAQPHKPDALKEGGLTTRLHVGHLTRNVTEEHLRLIFAVWGPLKSVEMAIDRVVELPKGYAHVEFEKREDADNAMDHMNGGQIDGNIVEVRFVQAPKKELSPIPVPPRRPEPIPTHRSDQRGRQFEAERRRSPIRHRRRSPVRRYSRSPRSPPRRRSPYHYRNRSPPRRGYNGGYAYDNRGPSPRRRRSPHRPRRRSPSPHYRRREPGRTSPSKRSRRSSSSLSSSMSKSSSMSTSASRSGSSSD